MREGEQSYCNYSVEAEGAGGIVPQDLFLARKWNRLFQERIDTPGESAVGMRIVSIPQEVVVADDIERRFQGRFVTAESDEEVAFEILSRAFGQILMLRVAAEIPVLFHPLQPVWNPSAVGLDLDDAEPREFFDNAVPDEARHRSHRLERMRQDVAGDMGVHAIAERFHGRRARIVGGNRASQFFDFGP